MLYDNYNLIFPSPTRSIRSVTNYCSDYKAVRVLNVWVYKIQHYIG